MATSRRFPRRRLLAVPGFLLLAACAGSRSPSAVAPLDGSAVALPGPSASALVTRDVDGDTVHVLVGGRDESVRLIGVDTPEISWGDRPGECFGPQAAAYTRARLQGRRVRLVFDLARRDRYGRLLAYVYLGRELVNMTLVRLGFARADAVPPDTRLSAAFVAAERSARAAARGMWGACPPSG